MHIIMNTSWSNSRSNTMWIFGQEVHHCVIKITWKHPTSLKIGCGSLVVFALDSVTFRRVNLNWPKSSSYLTFLLWEWLSAWVGVPQSVLLLSLGTFWGWISHFAQAFWSQTFVIWGIVKPFLRGSLICTFCLHHITMIYTMVSESLFWQLLVS